jgi:hypothetical protein
LKEAPLKAMQREVNAYREYLSKIDPNAVIPNLQLQITRIEWQGGAKKGDNVLAVRMYGQAEVTEDVSSENNVNTTLPMQTFSAASNQKLEISITVTYKDWFSTPNNGSATFETTPVELASGKKVDLRNTEGTLTASVYFGLTGYPQAPVLPDLEISIIMTAFHLIGQTPRAGELNHRFIVSPQCPFLEVDLQRKLAQASQQLAWSDSPFILGEDFIAVHVKRTQTSTGARQGDEWLVLVNAAIANYSIAQRDKVAQWLKDKLDTAFDELVKQVNWKEARGIVFKHPDIAQWENEIVDIFPDLLHVPLPEKNSVVSKSTKPSNKIIMGAAAVLVFIVAVLAFYFSSSENKTPENPPEASNQIEQPVLAKEAQKECGDLTDSQKQLFSGTQCEAVLLPEKVEDFQKCRSEFGADYCLITLHLKSEDRKKLQSVYFSGLKDMQALIARRDALRELKGVFDSFFKEIDKGTGCDQTDTKCSEHYGDIKSISEEAKKIGELSDSRFLSDADVKWAAVLDEFFKVLEKSQLVVGGKPTEQCSLLKDDKKVWDPIKRVLPEKGDKETVDDIRNSLKTFLQCTQENHHDERPH